MVTRCIIVDLPGISEKVYQDVLDEMFSNSSEIWMHARNHDLAEGRLLVSSMGRIARLPFKRLNGATSHFSITVGTAQHKGHMEVSWSVHWNKRDARGTPKRARAHVHQLVARTFLGPPPDRHKRSVVRHINGIPSDNRVENLVWGSDLDNQRDRLSKPFSELTAPYGLWVGPALHRRILAAIRGETDAIEVLKELQSRIVLPSELKSHEQ